MLDVPHCARVRELAQGGAAGLIAELEIAEVECARRARVVEHRGGVLGVPTERLVTQHGLARVQRVPDVRRVQERR